MKPEYCVAIFGTLCLYGIIRLLTERSSTEKLILRKLKKLDTMNELLEQQIIAAEANSAQLDMVVTNIAGIRKDYAKMRKMIADLQANGGTPEQIARLAAVNEAQGQKISNIVGETTELDQSEDEEVIEEPVDPIEPEEPIEEDPIDDEDETDENGVSRV